MTSTREPTRLHPEEARRLCALGILGGAASVISLVIGGIGGLRTPEPVELPLPTCGGAPVLVAAAGGRRFDCGTDRWLRPEEALWMGVAIDVNAVDAEGLTVVPGLGPGLAKRIVEDRRAHGRFLSPGQLMRVRGIGPRTLERIRPFVRAASSDIDENSIGRQHHEDRHRERDDDADTGSEHHKP